ncbi:13265_t:CDS:2 [Entrophospora sp. SA101]|nr:13265_t:CDS:2 [Entrophospora sp. SA101]
MGKKQHLFTPWFRLSIEKVNSTHKGAACRSCIKANPNKPIEDLYFTNKKETCLNHLKHCKHFKEEIGEAEYQQIINLDKSSTSNPTLVNKNSLSDDHEARNLSEEMVNIIESEGWWRNLEQLTILLHPIRLEVDDLSRLIICWYSASPISSLKCLQCFK